MKTFHMKTEVIEDRLYRSKIEGRATTIDAGSGRNLGQTPMELVLSALSGCATVDVLEILKKRRKQVEDLTIETRAIRRDEPQPHIFTKIEMDFQLTSPDANLPELEKAIQLSLDKYCSVRGMIGPQVEILARGHVHRPAETQP